MAKLYCRKNSKYLWVRYNLNGIPQFESTKCTKWHDADFVLKSKYIPLEVNSYNKMPIIPVKKTLKEALHEYRNNVLVVSHDSIKQKSVGTINRQQRNADNFLFYLEKNNLTEFFEITVESIKDYIQNHLIKECKKKPNTVYKDVQICQNFFRWAKKKFYCREDPTENIRNTKPQSNEPIYLTNEQVKKIFDNAKEPYLSMFRLLYHTGLRIQELLNIEWQDVSIEQRKIIIRVKEGSKTKRETSVSLNSKALEVIKVLAEQKGCNTYLFTNECGNQFAQSKISAYAVRLYKRLNIPTKSPLHIWRHTCASHLVIAGVSLYVVKEILRQKSIRETEIYATLSRPPIENALEKLVL
jgi:site-specific recombinase XerD